MNRIMALDPGGTTGWATYTYLEMPGGEVYDESYACGQLGPGDHHNKLDVLLGNQHTGSFIIVYEMMLKYKDWNSADMISHEYIGVIKRFAQERGVLLKSQPSATGKIKPDSFVRRQNLQALGLWSPRVKHAMDAYGHLLYYMLQGNGVPSEKRIEILQKGWK